MRKLLGLDQESHDLVGKAASLASVVLAAESADVDARGRFPREGIAALGRKGFLGIMLPVELGGLGRDLKTFAAVVEKLAQACPSTAMIYVMHAVATRAIEVSETLEDRETLLRDIAAGRHLSTLAFSERGSRSEFWRPVSRLEPAGSGYTVDAEKSWVTSAGHADSMVASARSPGANGGSSATVAYLLRRGAQGVRVVGSFDGLGLRGNDSRPVRLDGAKVRSEDLLTALGGGEQLIHDVILPYFSLGTAAMANGMSRAAVAVTAAHLRETDFEHRLASLCDIPGLRSRLGRMSVLTEESRALLATALLSAGDGAPPLVQTLRTRLAAIRTVVEVTDLAMKSCGGAAFSKHFPLEQLFRDARAGWVMAPTADQLEDFIGRSLTGLPLFPSTEVDDDEASP